MFVQRRHLWCPVPLCSSPEPHAAHLWPGSTSAADSERLRFAGVYVAYHWCLFCTRLLSWDAGGSKVLFSWVFFPVPVRQGRVPSYSARISTSAPSSVQAFSIRYVLASLATSCFCLMPCSGWRLLTAAYGFPILPFLCNLRSRMFHPK